VKYRALGLTQISVSEIGFGGWQLANPVWGMQDADEAVRMVQVARDAGCNFFDTAPGYSEGRSEGLLGRALHIVRGQVVLCSKFGHTAEGETNFDVAALRPAVAASLRRLQTDYLDVLLVHNPPADLMDGNRTALYGELERLKKEGWLRCYGVSLDSGDDLAQVVATTGSGVIEVLFNAFHQEPLTAFAGAQKKGVGLIAKVPLDSGWLSGKYRSDSRFAGVRDRWTPEIITRRAALVKQFADLVPSGLSLSHAALRYVLAQPELSTVIPGAKTTGQVLDNIAAGNAVLPPETVRAIRALWERELKMAPLPW
jgi:aryl-alcohol dehydrogenase-like predicted oxidoreductase